MKEFGFYGWGRGRCSLEGDVLGRELAPRNPDSHSFSFALFLILKAPSSVRLQGAPCEGRDGPGPYGREGQWESGLRGNRDVFCLLLFECMSSLKLVSGGQRPSMLIPQDWGKSSWLLDSDLHFHIVNLLPHFIWTTLLTMIPLNSG